MTEIVFLLNNNFTFYRARFGLFSAPVSTAIGDTNAYPQKKANLDEDGKVITGPYFKATNPMSDQIDMCSGSRDMPLR